LVLLLRCCTAGYCIAFIYNWRIALLITGAAPLIAVGGVLHVRLIFGQSTDSDKLYGIANTAVTEAIASIRIIQVGGMGTQCTAEYP
jgi:ATP-binding cassette subfamily B (MDR/TAP) protein 1